MTFFDLLRRDWKEVCRWKSPFFYLVLGVPIIYTLLFGSVYQQGTLSQIPIVICDQDHSSVSRSIIDAYDSSDKFKVVSETNTINELESELRNGTALSGVYIPPDFTKSIKTGHPVNIGVFINGTNLVYGNNEIPGHSELMAAINVGVSKGIAQGLGMPPEKAMNIIYPVHLDLRILGNPTNSYTNFMLLGLISNALQIGLFLVASTLLCREYNVIYKWRKTKSISILSVRFIGTWIMSLFSAFIVFLMAHYLFHVPMRANFLSFSLLTCAYTFLFIAICIFFSALFTNPVIASQIPMVYVMPGLLYSGMSWPYEWMGPWAKAFANLMPLTYYGESLRDLSLLGYAINYWHDFWCMSIVGCVLLVLTYGIFLIQRRRFEKKYAHLSADYEEEVTPT